MKWTCEGSVRGCCGITHRSYTTAKKCCDRDFDNIRRYYSNNSYSDRYPVPLDEEAKEEWKTLDEY